MPPFDPTIGPRDATAPRFDPAAAARLLEASAATVVIELEALGSELAHWPPGPDEWCATEVAGHLIEADRRGFAGRIERILAADRPVEAGWDQEAVARERGDRTRPVADVIAEFREGRAAGLAVVRGLAAEDLSRVAVHGAVGDVAIGELLHEWVFHDRNHLAQLLKVAQARAWPVMGNTRRFSVPDA